MFKESSPQRKVIYLGVVLTLFTSWVAACGGSGGGRTPQPCISAQELATAVQAGQDAAATFVAVHKPQSATRMVDIMTQYPLKACSPFEILGTAVAGTATEVWKAEQTAGAARVLGTAHVIMTRSAATVAASTGTPPPGYGAP